MGHTLTKMQIERQKALTETFEFLEKFMSFRDKQIYEIGCDRFFVSAIEMVKMGAASVECTNITDIDTALISNFENISFHNLNASKSHFNNESFDIVYGRAVLEHIHDIRAVVAEIQRLLRPGGMFYLDGGPMWTCRHGHHVWVNSPSGKSYIFAENNPFESWEHLLYNKDEMSKRLESRGIDTADAALIIQHVYVSDDMCRIPPQTIIDAFEEEDNFEVQPVRIAVGGEPPKIIKEYSKKDLRTGKLIIIGRKLTDDDRRGDFKNYVSAGLNLIKQRFIF